MIMKQLVVASLAGFMLAGVAFGGNGLNPQFLKWRKMKAAGMLPQQKRAAAERQVQDASATIALTPAARASLVGDDAGNGLAPDAADLSYLADCNVPPSWKPVNGYPKSFDLRTSGNVTAARRQGNFETCWAFASMGSLESSILVQKPANKNYTAADVDFSERHMVDNHGFDLTPQHGGSMLMAMAYLTRWGGPVMENAFPYPSADATEWSSLGGADAQPLLHVQHVRWLPGKTKYLENDLIKDSVLSLGGVYVTYFDNASFYNADKAAYYCNITKEVNHGVLIIGWNDDYPASNFTSASGAVPPGPGAYLVKNNRGEDWGDNGCFWVSYYDNNFAVSAMAVFNGFESKSNYSTIYQHDPLGYTGKAHSGNASRNSGTAWMANVFTANTNDQIAAVGFYALFPGMDYKIKIYTELSGADPSTGTMRKSNAQNGTAQYAGYVTVPLEKIVPVEPGERFAVCVELTKPKNIKVLEFLPCEAPVNGYSVRASAQLGESFFSSKEKDWRDLQSNMQGANFCIKAYGIGDKDEWDHLDQIEPTALDVTGPSVVPAGDTGKFSLAVVFEDNSRYDGYVPDYEIISGIEALSAHRADGSDVLLTVREDLAEDMDVTVRFSATEDYYDVTVSKEITFKATHSRPAAPTGLVATVGEVDSGVRLAWDAVANASGYTVYRSTSADVRNAVFLANAEINRYTDTSAVPGIDYTYFVKALNSSGASAFSEGGTGWRKLAAPADFIATDGDYDYVQLSWSAVEGASFYKVFRATDMDAVGNPVDPVELTGWIEGQSYRDTPPEKGVQYFYWVKSALSWTGYRPSDYSIFDPGSRKAPVVLSGVQIDGPATVPAGETASYTLAAMFSDGSRAENVSNAVWNCSLGGEAVTGDRFSFTALVDGYKVSSNTLVSVTAQWAHSTEDGTVTKADTKYIVIAPVIPSKPNAPKISASGTDGISVVWDSVEAAYSYRLYRGETAESAQLLQTTAALSYLDATVIPGAAVRYWIEAENAAGVSPRSEASVAAMRRFTPPVYVSASNGTSTEDVTVSWRAVTGAKFYRVARADSPDGVKRDMSGWIAERTFADTTAEPGVTYWYFVQAAYDAEGGSASDWSNGTIGKVSPAQTLAFIEIDGPSSIQYDSSGSFVCTATYANGVQKRVNPTWSFKAPNELVSVNAAGVVTAGHVRNEDLHLELQASFTDNGVTKTDSFAVTVIAWKAVTPQVFVSNVVVRARWPWNGLVDISYDLYSVPETTRAVVTVVGRDHDLNQTLQAVTLTGDGADYPAAGGAPHKDCRVVWNLGADYTNFHASAFSVSLDAAPYAVAAPADFRASDGTSTNAVELAWETAFGAVHYEIFRSLTNNRDDAELLVSVTNATEFADVTAEHGETYYYWIRTVAGEFEEDISEESGPVAGKRATPPYSAPAVNLQNGLVAYYPFDSSRDDASGNRNHMHLSLRDAPAQVADRNGREGAAYRFAGRTQFETTTNRYRIVKLSGEFTFSCWVRTDKSTPLKGEQMLGINTGCNFLVHPSNAEFMEGEAGVNVGYGIAVGSNGVNLFEHCDSFLPATLRYAANLGGGWHHVAFTVKDNGAPVLYVDGAYAKTGIDTGKLKHLFVGDNFGGEVYGNYTGDADDICYYDRALEPEEIAALFEAGSPLVADRPVSVKPEIDVAYADGAATVTISCEEVGAGDNQPTVYYTISRTDGGDTVDAREYTVPFTVEGDATVTAWSAKDGYYDSPRVKVQVKADWRETVIGTIGDGNGKIEWSTSGDGDWVFDPNESADARNGSMRSGRIVANGNSVLTATFTGAGTFAFDWKVSSESQFDFLTLTVDGETPHRISGEMDWTEMVLEFTNDVQHVVSWTYAKDGNVSRGSDCGWVDYITWAPAGTMVDAPQATITPLGAGVSNVVTIACANTPGATIEYRLDLFGVEGEWKTYAEPLVVEGDGIIHMRAKKQGYIDSFVSSQKIRRLWIVRANEALLMDPVTRRNVRLEGDYFEYGIDEEYWWDQDRSVVSDGTCASMTNPDLMDGEYASMFARFSGMGTFFFDRKVDSEAGWDVLTYFAGEDGMDYSYADAISGDRDWERVKLVFRTAGEHVIEWEYNKDDTGSNGRDRGWVDYLQWVPARFAPAVPDPRTGYVFGGWTTNENGAVVYEPGVMLDAMDKTETFIPVWTPISYRVAYDAERVVGDGRLEQTFVYDTPQSLVCSTNFLFARGYTFSGWTTNEQNTVDFTDEATVMNLAATADAVVTLRPVFAVNGYTVRFYDGSQKVADDIAAKYGEAFALPALDSTSNRRFDGWSVASGGAVAYAGGASVKDLTDVDGGTVTLYACWTEISVPYAEAIDLPGQEFISGGDAKWIVQSDVVRYGKSALRSGAITANGSSTLSTVLTRGERLRLNFWWKVSSEQGWDKLRFSVNGKEMAAISGLDGDWQQYTIILNAGTNTLQWAYTKDGTGDRGEDCGWLDYMTIERMPEIGDVDVIHVKTTGDDKTADGTEARPFKTIQRAVDAARDGMTVLVHPGNYSENVTVNAGIVLASAKGPKYTTICGTGAMRPVVQVNGGLRDGMVWGFTLTGGMGNDMGVNTYGGALALYSDTQILDCIMCSNGVSSTTFAGAVHVSEGARVHMENCLMYENYAWACGGATLVEGNGHLTVSHSTAASNHSDNYIGQQGGLGVANTGTLVVSNSISYFNDGLQLAAYGSYYGQESTIMVALSCVQGGVAANGAGTFFDQGQNFASNPNFYTVNGVPFHSKLRETKDIGFSLSRIKLYGKEDVVIPEPEPEPAEEPVFKVIQYTISRQPYTIDDALAATNTPSIWLDDPVTATYTQINFGDNVKLAQNFPNGMVSFPGNVSEGRKATYYVCQITGKVRVTEAGEWTLACGSDDGFRCILTDEDGKAYSFEYFRDRSYDTTIKTFNFAKAGVYDLYLIYFEYGDASVLDLSCAKGKYSRFNKSAFKLLGTPASGIPLVGKKASQPQEHDKVQLWENGPYWATANIGAEKPEDSGYYFWWGDTVGYKWENERWVASDGSSMNFSFATNTVPTGDKDISILKSEGWITEDGVLAPEHDAAHVQWGEDWRMPTEQEFKDLNAKCDWTLSTINGVKGWVICGRGDYSLATIFIPCAGFGVRDSIYSAGSYGHCWSSVPYSKSAYAWSLYLGLSDGNHGADIYNRRYGQPIRPIQAFTK